MKIEAEIPDINRDEVIEAMARQLLTRWTDDYDTDTGSTSQIPRPTKLGLAVRSYLDEKIGKLAETLVREGFDAIIKARITTAVDEVLAAGWQVTDSYGNARVGQRVDLKGRISEVLTTKSSEYGSSKPTLLERLIAAKVEEVFSRELKTEIDKAPEVKGSIVSAVLRTHVPGERGKNEEQARILSATELSPARQQCAAVRKANWTFGDR